MNQEIRFTDVVDWEKHIEPYRLIQFVAGVGAGKNYWVENTLMNDMKVLLITSRKAKVKETGDRKNISTKLDLNELENRNLGMLFEDEEKKYNNCVCNNSHIETYWKYHYKPDDETTHLWNYFDIIVVDEAHSMATDATFSDAPFHLYSFLNHVFKQKTIKLIFMTATPKPILDIVHTENLKARKKWDLTNDCVNILPDKVHIDTQENILKEIVELYKNKKNKVIYYVNSIPSMNRIIEQLKEKGIPQEKITVGYSKSNKKVDLPEELKNSKKTTENYLRKHEDLPEDKFILITTSRNKEGINIKNDDVNWYMYTESHYNDECIQMWGRARSGLQKFTIDNSAQQHPPVFCDGEPSHIMSMKGVKCARKTLETWYEKQKSINPKYTGTYTDAEYYMLKDCIKEIEKRFDFLRYDVIKKDFIMYSEKEKGCRNHAKAVSSFETFVEMKLGKTSNTASAPFDLPCVVSPDALKHKEKPQPINYHKISKELKNAFQIRGWIDKASMTSEDVEKLKAKLYKVGIAQKNGTPYSQINPALKLLGFQYVKGHHKGDLGKIVELKK